MQSLAPTQSVGLTQLGWRGGGGEWQRPPASLEGQCDRLHGSLAGTPGPGVDQPPFPAIPFPAIGVPMGEPGEAPEGYPLQGYTRMLEDVFRNVNSR